MFDVAAVLCDPSLLSFITLDLLKFSMKTVSNENYRSALYKEFLLCDTLTDTCFIW